MEQMRKNLKLTSIAVLALAVFSLLQIVSELLFGELSYATIPEGVTEDIILITKIFVCAVSFLLTLPNVYVGIKGLIIAKEPNCSGGHIIWAIILLAFASFALIENGIALGKNGFVYENISAFLSVAVEVLVFAEYIRYAIAVKKTVA